MVIHFCGRGENDLPSVPDEIKAMSPQARLSTILREQRLRGFRQYHGGGPAVCFSEPDQNFDHVGYLINAHNYAPWGLAIKKLRVATWGGGPALYLRGSALGSLNELAKLEEKSIGSSPNADHLLSLTSLLEPPNSDWLWTQEWRLPVAGNSSEGEIDFTENILKP